MAFLNKERKFFNFELERNKTPGPGEYISQTPIQIIRQNLAPFNSKERRMKTKEKQEINPGPGAYNQNNNIKALNKKYKKNLNIFEPQNLSQSISKHKPLLQKIKNKSINKNENCGFDTKEKRFALIKDTELYPGPGTYFKAKNNTTKIKKIKGKIYYLNDLENKKYSNRNENTVNSIPSKDINYFGFEPNKEGVKKVKNPDLHKTFTGIGKDTVGPGSYDIILPEQWLRTGTEWSKSISKRIELSNKEKKEVQRKKIIEEVEKNKTYNKTEFFDYDLFKSNLFKKKYLNLKYQVNNNNIQHISKLETFIDNEIKKHQAPGPGYYFDDEKFNSFSNKNIRKFHITGFTFKKNNTRCKSESNKVKNEESFEKDRFAYQTLNNFAHETPGPDAYFKDRKEDKLNLTYQKTSFKNNFKKPGFNSKCERFKNDNKDNKDIQNCSNQQLKYNNSQQSFNKKYKAFGSNSDRFENKVLNLNHIQSNEINPGPGSYIDPYSGTGTCNTLEYKGRLISIEKAKKIKKHKHIPAVNLKIHDYSMLERNYNSEYFQCIQYDSFKKSNWKRKVPFESLVPKSIPLMLNHDIIGPGSYFDNNNNKKVKQMFTPFNNGEIKKFGIGYKQMIGPGLYELSTAYPWLKKEFNAEYTK